MAEDGNEETRFIGGIAAAVIRLHHTDSRGGICCGG
jgi:hypothetical protein